MEPSTASTKRTRTIATGFLRVYVPGNIRVNRTRRAHRHRSSDRTTRSQTRATSRTKRGEREREQDGTERERESDPVRLKVS